jgi:hypothetical protein
MMDVQEETLDEPRMQQCLKGPRHKRAAMRQQVATISEEGDSNREWHQREELRPAIISGKQRNTQETLYEISRLMIAKQIVGTSSGLQRMMDWTLWRG